MNLFAQPVQADAKCADKEVMHLLVPVSKASDVIYGARHAKKMMSGEQHIHIVLLHVTKPRREEASLHSFSTDIDRIEEEHAEALLKEAALYLSECQISHRTYIISGDVVFSILDAAELLNSDAIVLPATKRRSWLRPFSSDIVSKIAHAARSVPVVLIDTAGLIANGGKAIETSRKKRMKSALESA